MPNVPDYDRRQSFYTKIFSVVSLDFREYRSRTLLENGLSLFHSIWPSKFITTKLENVGRRGG